MFRQLVVSRYKEDIRWIQDSPLPAIVYNKGPELRQVYGAECVRLTNVGRETHTYLQHIINRWDDLADYTIFTQGDPLEHSPDFIKLLSYPFTETQPLSWRWKEWDDVFGVGAIPPLNTRLTHKEYWIDDCRIYVEYLNHSFQPLLPHYYFDFGRDLFLSRCRKSFKVGQDETLRDYFWKKIFGDSEKPPLFIPFCFAGIFGVSKRVIQSRNKSFYENCLSMLLEHSVSGYIFERLWLSIFHYDQKVGNRYLETSDKFSGKRPNFDSVSREDLFRNPGFWRFCCLGLWLYLVKAPFRIAWACAGRFGGFVKKIFSRVPETNELGK